MHLKTWSATLLAPLPEYCYEIGEIMGWIEPHPPLIVEEIVPYGSLPVVEQAVGISTCCEDVCRSRPVNPTICCFIVTMR